MHVEPQLLSGGRSDVALARARFCRARLLGCVLLLPLLFLLLLLLPWRCGAGAPQRTGLRAGCHCSPRAFPLVCAVGVLLRWAALKQHDDYFFCAGGRGGYRHGVCVVAVWRRVRGWQLRCIG